MHKPRFPLRWRHRLFRMAKPRTLQGLSLQLAVATALLIAALHWTGHLGVLGRLWTAWTG